MNTSQELCVVGAGPKALAIAAKAMVLEGLGFQTPKIVILEKTDVAAHWTGNSGFTNGKLPLGTSPEKDVGFPYASFCWGSAMNSEIDRLMRDFSWHSFLIANHRYSDWVDRGRPAPNHRKWAEYLKWIWGKVAANTTLCLGRVEALALEGDRWRVRYRMSDTGDSATRICDGIVLTGPGRLTTPAELPNDDRVLTVQRFWNHVDLYTSRTGARFAVVGTGENAASVAVTLGLSDEDLKIDIISPVAMNYSRGESYVENHVYTDPFQGNWFQLTPENRRDFIYRTDRGVFSITTKAMLDQMESIEIIPGRLTEIEIDSMDQLLLSVEYNQDREKRCYDYVIIAAGFDHLGFVKSLFDDGTETEILSRASLPALTMGSVELAIDENLALRNLRPRLHLPMLSGLSQGPGFANLSSLGRLSDHVLAAYVGLDADAVDNPCPGDPPLPSP